MRVLTSSKIHFPIVGCSSQVFFPQEQKSDELSSRLKLLHPNLNQRRGLGVNRR